MLTYRCPKVATLPLAVFFLLSSDFQAQSPSWSWATDVAINEDMAIDFCTHPSGGVFVAGGFTELSQFGSYPLSTQNCAMFIASFTNSGEVDWAIQNGGENGCDEFQQIEWDHQNGLFVTGTFQSEMVVFGSDTLHIPEGAYNNVFLAKYDMQGNSLWGKSPWFSIDNDWPGENRFDNMVSDNSGNLYVSGTFADSLLLDNVLLTNTALGYDAFIAKYDIDGNLEWAISPEGGEFRSITLDSDNNVSIAGSFHNTMTLGNITIAGGSYAHFAAKLNSNGEVIWLKKLIDSGDVWLQDVQCDEANNIFISGNYSNELLEVNGIEFTNSGMFSSNPIIIKLNTDGDFIWVKSWDNENEIDASSLAMNADNEIFITGSYSGNSFTAGSFTLVNNSADLFNDQLYVMKLDADGNILWLNGGESDDQATGSLLEFDENGNLSLLGIKETTSLTWENITLNSTDEYSIFLARFGIPESTEEYSKHLLNIYPTPASEQVTVKVPNDNQVDTYTVANIAGLVILRGSVQANTMNIDLKNFPSGSYYIKAYGHNITATGLIIKE